MRCVACNVELNDYEATRKDVDDQYIDLCNHCFSTVSFDFEVSDRIDLLHEADISYEKDDESLQFDQNMLKY
jgi:hypothetical protein